MEFRKQESMALHTTMRVGGPARFFVEVHTMEELEEAVSFAQQQKLPMLFLGSGSNLLVRDAGFDGVVIHIALKGTEVHVSGEGIEYILAAGELWDNCVEHATHKGWWGIENLSGIPGTVGAAPVQNIGAYGVELKDVVTWVEAWDTKTHVLTRYTKEDCEFSYRSSFFKQHLDRYVIVRVALSLTTHPRPQLTYADVARVFADHTPQHPLEIREAILHIRERKFPDLSQEGTAGSFFLNPVISTVVASSVLERYPAVPHFVTEQGIKLSLAWLLDHALRLRGYRKGGARLYEQQPLVVVTNRTATAHDVCLLKEYVIEQAQSHLHLSLTPEVRII